MAAWLWWAMFAVSVVVLVAVVVLWLYAIFRRPRAFDEQASHRTGLRWVVGGGLALPIVSVTLLLIFGIPVGHRMLPLPVPGTTPLVIEVIGHQWWWEVHYPESGVTTANELHLPVDRPIDVHVTSDDVIHSFWVPNLAGKIDMLPARTHVHRLHADRVGRFRGQCSEYCGHFHAHMVMIVDVHSRDDFQRWLDARLNPIETTGNEQAAQAFAEHCGDCHRVAGVSEGDLAPDLSTIGARTLLGGRPRGDSTTIFSWLTHHPRARESAPVPDHSAMAPEDLEIIANWLETLGNE